MGIGAAELVILTAMLLSLPAAVWVYLDAQQRRKPALLRVVLTLFTWPLGFLAYLVARW